MLSKEIGAGAARLMAAACSQRRMRSYVAPMAAAAVSSMLADKAVVLSRVASDSTLAEGGGNEIRGELVCFVDPDARPHDYPPNYSHHPRPRHL